MTFFAVWGVVRHLLSSRNWNKHCQPSLQSPCLNILMLPTKKTPSKKPSSWTICGLDSALLWTNLNHLLFDSWTKFRLRTFVLQRRKREPTFTNMLNCSVQWCFNVGSWWIFTISCEAEYETQPIYCKVQQPTWHSCAHFAYRRATFQHCSKL